MPPYLYPLPSTSLISFSQVLLDPSTLHGTDLSDATAARTKLNLALKAAASDDQNASALAVIDAVQGYLPFLRGIIACLDADEVLFKCDPSFPWRSSLTHYGIAAAPLLGFPSIHVEHLFVLLAYCLALSNHAHYVLGTLPPTEPTPGTKARLTDEEEKRMSAGLAKAVDLLSQASGVAEWTAEHVIPAVDAARVASGGRIGKTRWPVETGSETFRGLAMISLADAHVTAIRRLLLPVLPHYLFAPPGPPLPPNHPSPSLLAKLHLHVASLYDSAQALFKAHASADGSSSSRRRRSDAQEAENAEGEVFAPLKRYLKKESLLASASAHRWLGIDAGENGKGQKVGEALALLKEAQSRLTDLEDTKMRERVKGLSIGKGGDQKKEQRKARRGRIDREIEECAAYIKAYKGINETVAFQPVPAVSTLTIPSGRPIFGSKKYNPPASKIVAATSNESDAPPEDEYAGKGNYF